MSDIAQMQGVGALLPAHASALGKALLMQDAEAVNAVADRRARRRRDRRVT
jgi:DNA-binding IclR family transcriptional regulator